MNATIASQILEEDEAAEPLSPVSVSIKKHSLLLSLLLLIPVALTFLLLPLLYLALTSLVAWGIFEYSNLVNQAFSEFPKTLRLTMALAPIIPAVILINALIRPLFLKTEASPKTFPVTRTDQPLLMSFVHQIADSIAAPRPGTIELDCEPRIAARSASRSLRNPDVRLVVGMPLLGNLTQQCLGGALARELSYFIHPVTASLRHAVVRFNEHVQDMADWKTPEEVRLRESIRRHSGERDFAPAKRWLLLPLLKAFRGLHAAVRALLKSFSLLSRAASAPLLRRWEMDADAYQVAISGSENFSTTMRRIARLEAAAKLSRHKVDALLENEQLSLDYPRLLCHLAETLPSESVQSVRESLSVSSRWMEFRPSRKERIQAAYRRDDAGILSSEKPASSLVADPKALGERVTRHWYQVAWGIDPDGYELHTNETLNRDTAIANSQLDAAEAFFGGSLNPFRPLFPNRGKLESFAHLEKVPTVELPEHYRAQAERNRSRLDQFDELVEARLNAVEFHQLALAGYPIQPGQTGQEENDPAALNSIIEFLDRQLIQVSMKLGPFEERCLRMLAIAVHNLGSNREKAAKVDNWFYHLAVVEQIYTVVPQLKDLATRLAALVRQRPDCDLSGQCSERFEIHMQVCELLKRIEDYLGHLPYPFDDYPEGSTMWDCLTADVGTRSEAVAQSASMANAVVDRIGEFYLRVMGQLATDLDHDAENDGSTLFDRWAKLASL